jgi:XTP/dITP diphosphohydrolase
VGVPLPESADLGATLLRQVFEARKAGEDAEAALRQAALRYAEDVRSAEQQNVRGAE